MQISEKTSGNNVKLIIIITASVLFVLLALCASFVAISVSKLNYDKIYDGVSIGTINVSKMSVQEAEELVTQKYDNINRTRSITLTCDDIETDLALSDINVSIDAAESAQAAFNAGRVGKWHERLKEIFEIKKNGISTDVVLTYDEEILTDKINELSEKVDSPERELTVEIEDDEIVVTRGKKGMRIIEEDAKKQINKAILDNSISQVTLKKEEVTPPELTVDYLLKEVCVPPQDASYKIENQRLKITDEKYGIEIDPKIAEQIIEESTGDIVRIPAKITQPKVTAKTIKETLFPDTLATFSTQYNAGNVSRSHNVALASELISETVLAPGDVFSYNDTVGPRTAARGFKEAGVYVGNRVEQGLGGGICQVSTTLFNAVVLADLKIVYRTNHSLPVSYADPGRDATVSYGSIDFKFSNSTDAPVKIVASAVNGVNTVTVYGTKKNPGRTIEITTENTGGLSYVTYKITKENGKVVKTEQLTKSTYTTADKGDTTTDDPEVPTPNEQAPISNPVPTQETTDNPQATADPAQSPANGSESNPEPIPAPVPAPAPNQNSAPAPAPAPIPETVPEPVAPSEPLSAPEPVVDSPSDSVG